MRLPHLDASAIECAELFDRHTLVLRCESLCSAADQVPLRLDPMDRPKRAHEHPGRRNERTTRRRRGGIPFHSSGSLAVHASATSDTNVRCWCCSSTAACCVGRRGRFGCRLLRALFCLSGRVEGGRRRFPGAEDLRDALGRGRQPDLTRREEQREPRRGSSSRVPRELARRMRTSRSTHRVAGDERDELVGNRRPVQLAEGVEDCRRERKRRRKGGEFEPATAPGRVSSSSVLRVHRGTTHLGEWGR